MFPVISDDHNLVRLGKESMIDLGDGAIEYINASPLCDVDPARPLYIAAQTPLPSTVADFWQMIWEQGSNIIVNLSSRAEGITDDRYWPGSGAEMHGQFEACFE